MLDHRFVAPGRLGTEDKREMIQFPVGVALYGAVSAVTCHPSCVVIGFTAVLGLGMLCLEAGLE